MRVWNIDYQWTNISLTKPVLYTKLLTTHTLQNITGKVTQKHVYVVWACKSPWTDYASGFFYIHQVCQTFIWSEGIMIMNRVLGWIGEMQSSLILSNFPKILHYIVRHSRRTDTSTADFGGNYIRRYFSNTFYR